MRHPFIETIDLSIDELTPGTSQCSLIVNPEKHHNPLHITHGGVFYALADTGMGAALALTLEEGESCVTIEIKINYFKAVREGTLRCQSEVIYRGKRIANIQSRIYLGETLVSQANGSFSIIASKNAP